jgi:hypothetical protein
MIAIGVNFIVRKCYIAVLLNAAIKRQRRLAVG